MSGDIEEFLKRAAERRAKKKKPRQPPVQPPPEIEIVEDVQILEPTGILSGETVADHVAGHIDTGDIGESTSRLGTRVGLSDDRMEAHLHETFEHQLGQLGTQTSAAHDSILDADSPAGQAAAKPPHPLGDLTKLFATPGDVRKAILLREIFDRPEHRW